MIDNLIGKRYGNLLITEDLGFDKYHIVKCLCDCSNVVNKVAYDNLRTGHTKSCGCLRYKLIGASYRGVTSTYWSRVKRCARKRDIEFNLSMEEAWNVLNAQNYRCSFTGKVLTLSTRSSKGNASIDRIDNSLGYVVNNIRWVDKEVNLMKSNFDDKRFLGWCELISSYILGLDDNFELRHTIQNSRFKGVGELSKEYWGKINRMATKRNINVEVNINYAWKLFEEQQYKCALTGIQLIMPTKKILGTASLDRIDSDEDYIVDNLQWVHKDINRMKLCLNNNQFKELCLLITHTNNVI